MYGAIYRINKICWFPIVAASSRLILVVAKKRNIWHTYCVFRFCSLFPFQVFIWQKRKLDFWSTSIINIRRLNIFGIASFTFPGFLGDIYRFVLDLISKLRNTRRKRCKGRHNKGVLWTKGGGGQNPIIPEFCLQKPVFNLKKATFSAKIHF